MKKNLKQITTATIASVLSLAMLASCGSSNTASTGADSLKDKVMGTVLLSVNPEIEIEYDGKGRVVEVEGVNDDGKNVVTSYSDFKGRECDDVVSELVQEIYDSGYFDQKVGGREKNIVIKLEEGSSYPDDDFLEAVAESIRNRINKFGLTSAPMTVDKDDIDDNGYINLETAKALVLAQLGFDEASFTEKEYELDDGVYELEFTKDGTEYEFEVDAVSGKVLEADYDRNDDWHDDIDDDIDDDRDDIDDDDIDDIDDDRDDIDDDIDDIDDDRDDIDDDIDDIDDRDDIDDDRDDIDDDIDDIDDDRDDIDDDDNDDIDDDDDDIDDDNDDIDDDDNDDIDDDDDDIDD